MGGAGQRFFMDFGSLQASALDYSRPSTSTDRVVTSFDGYSAYLLVVDEATRHVWVFLKESKDPPVEIASDFLKHFGLDDGGMIRCDQGGELA